MSHIEDIRRWRTYAIARGWTPAVYAPPLDRAAEKLGLKVAPSVFWSYWTMSLIISLQFGVVWGGFMYLTIWWDQPGKMVVLLSALAGATFGFTIGLLQKRNQKKLGLPSWAEFKRQHLS